MDVWGHRGSHHATHGLSRISSATRRSLGAPVMNGKCVHRPRPGRQGGSARQVPSQEGDRGVFQSTLQEQLVRPLRACHGCIRRAVSSLLGGQSLAPPSLMSALGKLPPSSIISRAEGDPMFYQEGNSFDFKRFPAWKLVDFRRLLNKLPRNKDVFLSVR